MITRAPVLSHQLGGELQLPQEVGGHLPSRLVADHEPPTALRDVGDVVLRESNPLGVGHRLPLGVVVHRPDVHHPLARGEEGPDPIPLDVVEALVPCRLAELADGGRGQRRWMASTE